MGNPGRPSMPHQSESCGGDWHVDLETERGDKLHIPVNDVPASYIIGQAYREDTRADRGR